MVEVVWQSFSRVGFELELGVDEVGGGLRWLGGGFVVRRVSHIVGKTVGIVTWFLGVWHFECATQSGLKVVYLLEVDVAADYLAVVFVFNS